MSKTEYSDKDWEIIQKCRQSITRALCGEVIPSLRKVRMEWDPKEKAVSFLFYHDGPIIEAIEDHYSSIGKLATCYDKEIRKINIKIIRCDYPIILPNESFIIYDRIEPFADPT